MKTFWIVFSLLLGVGPVPTQAEDAASDMINTVPSIMAQTRKNTEKMTLPVNKYADEGLKAARETSDHFHSPEFQEKIRNEEQRLAREVFADYTAPWKKKQHAQNGQTGQTGSLTNTEKIYLFFSSSVPDETVQAYIATIAAAGDPHIIPVLRGWVAGTADTKADTAYFSRILQKDPTCRNTSEPCQYYQVGINLQPSLFTRYGITRVPAVVYENNEDAYLIQGDAGLDHLLEVINREARSTALLSLIRKMRGT